MKHLEKPLKAVANQRRLEILKYLKEKKAATVGELAEHIKLSFKSTSKHLAVLLGADIVLKEQQGSFVLYALAPKLPLVAKSILSIL